MAVSRTALTQSASQGVFQRCSRAGGMAHDYPQEEASASFAMTCSGSAHYYPQGWTRFAPQKPFRSWNYRLCSSSGSIKPTQMTWRKQAPKSLGYYGPCPGKQMMSNGYGNLSPRIMICSICFWGSTAKRGSSAVCSRRSSTREALSP